MCTIPIWDNVPGLFLLSCLTQSNIVNNSRTCFKFKSRLRNEYHSFPFLYRLTFSVNQLCVKDFSSQNKSCLKSWTDEINCIVIQCLEAIQHCESMSIANIICTKTNRDSWRATTTTTAYPCDIHHRSIVNFLLAWKMPSVVRQRSVPSVVAYNK